MEREIKQDDKQKCSVEFLSQEEAVVVKAEAQKSKTESSQEQITFHCLPQSV